MSNRAAILTHAFKILKKHYKPATATGERPVLEHLLYACCLENSLPDTVDDVLASLQQNYFDWNEIRVTSHLELAEQMTSLNDPEDAALRLKRTLHAVFETYYSFDLEFLKKQNLGKSVKEIEAYNGVTPFVAAYTAQNALGGHSIPINRGALDVLAVLGVVGPADVKRHKVPGLERAIPKTKGGEFGSLIHQLGVDYASTPFSPRVRNVILEIAPEAKERLPKRGGKKEDEPPKKKAAAKGAKKAKPAKATKTVKKKSASKRLSRKKPR